MKFAFSISKNKDKILSAFEQNGKNYKRMRKSDKEDLDVTLLKWFKPKRTMNALMDDPMLMTKAKQLTKLLGHKNFVCCNDWID